MSVKPYKWLRDLVIVLLFWLSITLGVIVGAWLMQKTDRFLQKTEPVPTTYNGFATENQYRHFKRLHEFHGTLGAYETDDGEWLFERDGEVCSLWDPQVRTDRWRFLPTS